MLAITHGRSVWRARSVRSSNTDSSAGSCGSGSSCRIGRTLPTSGPSRCVAPIGAASSTGLWTRCGGRECTRGMPRCHVGEAVAHSSRRTRRMVPRHPAAHRSRSVVNTPVGNFGGNPHGSPLLFHRAAVPRVQSAGRGAGDRNGGRCGLTSVSTHLLGVGSPGPPRRDQVIRLAFARSSVPAPLSAPDQPPTSRNGSGRTLMTLASDQLHGRLGRRFTIAGTSPYESVEWERA